VKDDVTLTGTGLQQVVFSVLGILGQQIFGHLKRKVLQRLRTEIELRIFNHFIEVGCDSPSAWY